MSRRSILHTSTAGALALVLMVGCDDDEDLVAESFYSRTDLVSDQPGAAATVDPLLVNPWGIAYGPDTFFWVANNGTSTSTLYDGQGVSRSDQVGGAIELPSGDGAEDGPTGVVFNTGTGFPIGAASNAAPSRFIFATTGGRIIGWNPDIDARRGVIAVDESARDAVYTGLAIGTRNAVTRLYAANFSGAKIDVFDESFAPTSLGAAAFVDPTLPDGYAPFGVQAIEGRLYVAYAQQNEEGDEEVTGAGKGYVSVFELDGAFVARVASAGLLDAPWGIARAPEGFGRFGGALLIGNFGDGRITAFDANSFQSLGQLEDEAGRPIEIEGLWAITFGNGRMAGAVDTLYFAAGVDDETHGVFGAIGSSLTVQ